MIAAVVLSNLLYVVGAVIAATLLSAFILFRHRRPKSLEAGIEMFSRELRALQPERRRSLSDAAANGIGVAGVDRSGAGDLPRWDQGPGEEPRNRESDAGPGRRLWDRETGRGAAPGGAAPDAAGPGGTSSGSTRHVNMRGPGMNNLGYSGGHEARAPSRDVGDQPG